MSEFKIRAYGRMELAQLYSPQLTDIAAYRKMKKWISLCPGLLQRLYDLGYESKRRSFTPLEVRVIVDALGEPLRCIKLSFTPPKAMLYAGQTIVSVKTDVVIEMTTASVNKTGTVGTLFPVHSYTHARAYNPLPSILTNIPRLVSRFNQVRAVFSLIPPFVCVCCCVGVDFRWKQLQ